MLEILKNWGWNLPCEVFSPFNRTKPSPNVETPPYVLSLKMMSYSHSRFTHLPLWCKTFRHCLLDTSQTLAVQSFDPDNRSKPSRDDDRLVTCMLREVKFKIRYIRVLNLMIDSFWIFSCSGYLPWRPSIICYCWFYFKRWITGVPWEKLSKHWGLTKLYSNT